MNGIKRCPSFAFNNGCKTDWSSRSMGAAIYQADANPKALMAETTKNEGRKCIFDLTKSNANLRLRPLAFASRANTKAEQHYHIYVEEASVEVL